MIDEVVSNAILLKRYVKQISQKFNCELEKIQEKTKLMKWKTNDCKKNIVLINFLVERIELLKT